MDGLQCGSRSSVTVSNGFQRIKTEPTYFQKDLRNLLDSAHRPFRLKNISSSTDILSLETGPIRQKNRCLSTILEESQGIHLSPLLSHGTGFEESSSEKYHNSFNNSGMAGTIMESKGTSDEHS